VITGGEKGRRGAMDIWSLGCCIIEMTTGRRPWSNLDNEWAVMYHVATGCPPLPEASQLSEQGIDFLQQCFIRSPHKRPSAQELLSHPWITNYIEMCAEEPRYDDYETYESDYYPSPKSPETPAQGSSRIVRSIIGSMPVDGHPDYVSGGTQAQQYFKNLSAAKDELGIGSVNLGTDTNGTNPKTNMTGAAAVAASSSNQGSIRSEASSLQVSERSMPSPPIRRPSTTSVRSEASSRDND
jgi:serine/threonine protein kinase